MTEGTGDCCELMRVKVVHLYSWSASFVFARSVHTTYKMRGELMMLTHCIRFDEILRELPLPILSTTHDSPQDRACSTLSLSISFWLSFARPLDLAVFFRAAKCSPVSPCTHLDQQLNQPDLFCFQAFLACLIATQQPPFPCRDAK